MLHGQMDSSVRFSKEFSSCHRQGFHSELASSPSTSRVSSVLVDNFFLQSGIRSSFLELASNISFAVCLKFTALYVSPKISLCGQILRTSIQGEAQRTCPPCWWCWGSPPTTARRAFWGQAPRRSLPRSSKVEPVRLLALPQCPESFLAKQIWWK